LHAKGFDFVVVGGSACAGAGGRRLGANLDRLEYMLMRVYTRSWISRRCHGQGSALSAPAHQHGQFIRPRQERSREDPCGIETDNIKRALAGLKSCKSDDFKFAVQAMDQITTPANEKMVQGTLGVPRDR